MLDIPDAPPAGADYLTVKRAIEFITKRYRDQPSIEAIAEHVGLSASHFQHVFKRWAGLTPKAFLQAVTIERARELLRNSASVLDAAYDVGLSGPSRLHDLFVAHEALTPGDYRRDDLTLGLRLPCLAVRRSNRSCGPGWHGGSRFRRRGKPRSRARRHDAALAPRPARLRTVARQPLMRAAPSIPPSGAPDAPLRVVLIGTDFELRVWETLLSVGGARHHLFGHRLQNWQADGRARRRRRGGEKSDLVRRPLSSRAGALGSADRLPLGARAQTGDHRLGGGAGQLRRREARSTLPVYLRLNRGVLRPAPPHAPLCGNRASPEKG